MRSRRRVLWGLAAAALYVGTALVLRGAGSPVLPMFDGLAPPGPYRWVSPPRDLVYRNLAPTSGHGTISHRRKEPFAIVTSDGQAQVSGTSRSFEQQHGALSVRVTITPVDPAKVGPPPSGLSIGGNAYEVRAAYEPCCDQAKLRQPITVLLRYPIQATTLVRWNGTTWLRQPSTVVRATLQVFGSAKSLGDFAAAGPPTSRSGPTIVTWAALGLGGMALIIAGVSQYLRRKRLRGRQSRPARRRNQWR